MLIVLGIIFGLLAVLVFLWTLNTMLSSCCPSCYEATDQRQMVVPIIPLVRCWCPACNSVMPFSEAKRLGKATAPAATPKKKAPAAPPVIDADPVPQSRRQQAEPQADTPVRRKQAPAQPDATPRRKQAPAAEPVKRRRRPSSPSDPDKPVF